MTLNGKKDRKNSFTNFSLTKIGHVEREGEKENLLKKVCELLQYYDWRQFAYSHTFYILPLTSCTSAENQWLLILLPQNKHSSRLFHFQSSKSGLFCSTSSMVDWWHLSLNVINISLVHILCCRTVAKSYYISRSK